MLSIAHTTTDLLTAQADWLRSLQQQNTASPSVPVLLARIDTELAARKSAHIAILASIKPLTRGYVAMREWAI